MKKFSIILIVLLSFSFYYGTVYAQDKPLKFGIRGKYNMADVTENLEGVIPFEYEDIDVPIDVNQKMSNTFGFGGFVEYWFNPTFAVQLNAQYNIKGTKVEADFNTSFDYMGFQVNLSGNADMPLKLTYISFPILAKIALGDEGAVRPYLIAGPEISFLSSAKVKVEGTATAKIPALDESETQSIDEEEDIKDEVESTEFAMDFGGGVLFPVGNINLFIDAQYSLGLSKINTEGSDDVKNKVIYISLGLVF
jgi:hypothetical protein